jgi:hypothetical protein
MPGKRSINGPLWHGNPTNQNLSPNEDIAAGEFLAQWVCFATTPVRAWEYSHGAWRSEGTFDLWSVVLDEKDEVHVNPMWGDRIIEVRVHNRIPKSRLVWVGERTVTKGRR